MTYCCEYFVDGADWTKWYTVWWHYGEWKTVAKMKEWGVLIIGYVRFQLILWGAMLQGWGVNMEGLGTEHNLGAWHEIPKEWVKNYAF